MSDSMASTPTLALPLQGGGNQNVPAARIDINKPLRALQNRLERMELEHLRQHALELQERLEQSEEEANRANESAEFWQRHAMELQEALRDENFATHRCIGINKGGELMVVKHDGN